MEKEFSICGEYHGTINLEYLPYINYALVLNKDNAFGNFTLRNDSSYEVWNNVRIILTGDLLEPCQMDIPQLRPGQTVSFEDAALIPVVSKLMALTESVQSAFVFTLTIDGKELLRESLPLMLMAFDQWQGTTVMPESLAAFVTPNHPCIPALCLSASKYLELISGCRDLDEYMSKDHLRVLSQIKSIYRVLLDEDITYITSPASFEPIGQRVRLVDKVLKDKLGNCLELSLLLCSCLESIGVRPMMLLYRGHAIMGAWLEPVLSVPMVGYDEKIISDSIQEEHRSLLLIDSTCLTRGESFSEAVRQGEDFFAHHSLDFENFVDIHAARLNFIRPLPHCVLSDRGWEIHDTIEYDTLFDEIASKDPYGIQGPVSKGKLKAKQLLWERKLLDLSLRNNLLNMKQGKHIVPLKKMPIDVALSHLQAEQLADYLDDKDGTTVIKELFRAARISIEENGVNTLFMSIGTLQWYETDSKRGFLAPILFLPIEIVRHGSRKYIIRVRDEEPMVNITLLEMLRQIFDLKVPSLTAIPEDEHEIINWKHAFSMLSAVIEEVNEKQTEDTQWQIIEECRIGIFSFSKFVMWNDIHSHPEALESHPLLRSLMEGRLELPEEEQKIDVRELDQISRPADYAIPLDADSSQLEAIASSGSGHSFILYGPPGTGKSQTITNMIANALYQNKRVLFVAEKKAALEVVQERLKSIGLEPFCLELHSNKVDKKSFLAQMEMALDVPLQTSVSSFTQNSEELFAQRQILSNYAEALHVERQEGLSLFDYINRYLEIDGDTIPLGYDEIRHLSIAQVDEISRQCSALDIVQDIIGHHPHTHPLLGLYPRENTVENQQKVTQCLSSLPESISLSQQKAIGWPNRWLFKRSAIEILKRREEWTDLVQVADIAPQLQKDIERLAASAAIWNKNKDKLRLWYHFSLREQQLQAFGVPSLLDYYLLGHSGKETANAFRKGFYMRMALNILDSDPVLRSFNGMLFEDIIQRYRTQAALFQELTRNELVSRLSQRLPRIESADRQAQAEITFLRKRIAAHGRAYTIRRMINETQHILPQLCPCMLMSPLSVAQYLDMKGDPFDLVIFDEASQIPTSEAVGAIARGKTTVIVGDPKQMPPTSFFLTSSTNDNDAEIDDLESILDDCISLSLPGHILSWHYRSKHESLIAFSNTHFYDGKLITFPSVDDQARKVSVQHVDGTYDFGRTRSNKDEAQAIVDEVVGCLERMLPQEDGTEASEPRRSIGIVAFSIAQSSLIEDMLMDTLAKHPQLEELAIGGEEPIFVKNLENVQGDERDIILLSVGYGPNKDGKISMNFGPLNWQGGERRLNVAVSRARYEMKVFSTLHSHQIDLQRTSAKGVLALKRFLEYAETGILPCPSCQLTSNTVYPIITTIAEQLRQQGYEVHTQVGRSNFKIDIAIVDRNHPDCYERGIILDSPNYYSTPTVRDREIVQPQALSILGWSIERRWTTDILAKIS